MVAALSPLKPEAAGGLLMVMAVSSNFAECGQSGRMRALKPRGTIAYELY
jgi:hypothetical protein